MKQIPILNSDMHFRGSIHPREFEDLKKEREFRDNDLTLVDGTLVVNNLLWERIMHFLKRYEKQVKPFDVETMTAREWLGEPYP